VRGVRGETRVESRQHQSGYEAAAEVRYFENGTLQSLVGNCRGATQLQPPVDGG
jgi:hypothetical protein